MVLAYDNSGVEVKVGSKVRYAYQGIERNIGIVRKIYQKGQFKGKIMVGKSGVITDAIEVHEKK